MDYIQENESIITFLYDNEQLNVFDFLFSKDLSSRLVRKCYKRNGIYINNNIYKKGCDVKKGDKIVLVLEDEKPDTKPEDIDFEIIYEDNDLLIINKEPFMVVHPTKSHKSNTLSNGIANYFITNNIRKKIRFVNRLDMNTSGILIVAKNPFAHQQMALQLERNSIRKKYKAIVEGQVKKDIDRLDLSIGREEETSIKKIVTENGQSALTLYRVLKRFNNMTLLDVEILTGRSHQIRVHLNHIGHPILGDTLYGRESPLINRQALHSYYIEFIHPRTKKKLDFIADLPKDMKEILEQPNYH